MILHWMLYCTAVALLLGVAAGSLENVVRQRGWQVRWLWGGALLGSAVLPAVAFLIDARREALALARLSTVPEAGAGVRGAWLMDPFTVVPEPAFDLGPWLLALWATGSAVALLSLALSYLALERRTREWARREVDGEDVWVAPDTGPAVVGFLRSRIVLPEWVLERSAEERGMVLAHEAEHLRAGDPRLLLGALVLVASLPWNPALWWQWRRLRQAVEVDCDLRVLARGLDPRAYGRLLVEVTERGTAHRLAVAALSESQSSLERRIRLMFTPRPHGWWLRATGGAVLAVLSIAVACTADIPSGPGTAPAVNATSSAGAGSQDFAYEVAVLSRAPQLSNKGEIAGVMERLYPSLLQNAGIGGTVVAQFVIQPDGTTDPGSIKVLESPREELSAATTAAILAFRFRPGQYKGENVRTLIQMPITWQPARSTNVLQYEPAAGSTPPPNWDPAFSPGLYAELGKPGAVKPGTRAEEERAVVRSSDDKPQFAYEVAVLDRVPELANKSEIHAIMEELYPPLLQASGIGGTVVVQFVVGVDGLVDRATMKVLESERPELSDASLKALERFRFRPGAYKGENARTLIQMPITWKPKG